MAISRTGLLTAVVVAGVRTAAAQNATAEALFIDGERLMAAGKTAEACDAFDGSNRIEPRAGTLINLGLCREKNGQLASAWSAFKDAATRAKDPSKKQIADARIAVIEPRLSYLTVSVPDESRIDGLVVMRNGAPLDPVLWNRALPVDGGSFVIGGKAPGHEEWTTTTIVPAELGRLSVEVPRFKALVTLVPPPETTPPPVEPTPPVVAPSPAPAAPVIATPVIYERRPDPGLSGQRKAAIVFAVLGLGAVGGGVYLGLQATGLEDDAFSLCPDPATPCRDATRAQDLLDQGHDRALLANIAYGVGAATLLTATIMWLTGGSSSESVTLTPRVGADQAAVDIGWRF